MIVSDESLRLFAGLSEGSRHPDAVALAVALVEDQIGRPLVSQEHTETLRVLRNGTTGNRFVVTRHRPVTVVDTDAGWEILTGAMLGVPDDADIVDGNVDVTYTAGWTVDTLPASIGMVVAQIAAQFVELSDNGGPHVSPSFEQVVIDGAGGTIVDPGPWGIERLAPGATAILRRWKVGR